MFKRVKTLLASGVLVLGMAMPAFADGNNWDIECFLSNVGSHAEGRVHYIEDENVVKETDFDKEVFKKIDEKQKDGLVIEKLDSDKDGYDKKYVIYADKDYDNVKDSPEVIVETIYIDFGDDVSGQKGWIDEITPGTGDALALGGLAVAAVAAGGLTIVNKKRNK